VSPFERAIVWIVGVCLCGLVGLWLLGVGLRAVWAVKDMLRERRFARALRKAARDGDP